MTATEKRLFRILTKLVKRPQILSKDDTGGYNGSGTGSAAIRIPPILVRCALERGLLMVVGDSLQITDATASWLRRGNTSKSFAVNIDDRFTAQHWQLEEREIFDDCGGLTKVRMNVEVSPLLSLYRQRDKFGERFLSDNEFAAGEKLRNDYVCSNMGKMSGSNWTGIARDKSVARSVSQSDDGNIRAIDAKRRVMGALASVGSMLDRVLFSVLLREQGLNSLEMNYQWPNRSAKVVLKIALAKLAAHYGL